KGVRQAGVIDDGATREGKRAIDTAPRAVVQARVAARDTPEGVKAGQIGACPGLAVVGGARVARGGHARLEGAGTGKRNSGPRAEWLANLLIGAGDQDTSQGVAGDGRLVLLVLWECQVVILVFEKIAGERRSVRRGSSPLRGEGADEQRRSRALATRSD